MEEVRWWMGDGWMVQALPPVVMAGPVLEMSACLTPPRLSLGVERKRLLPSFPARRAAR